jgi:hypothetical protein
MPNRSVIISKSIKGLLIRLIRFRSKYIVNVFTSSGGLHSWKFSSLDEAKLFYNFLLASVKRNNKKDNDQSRIFFIL